MYSTTRIMETKTKHNNGKIIITCPDLISITRMMAFSGVKSDGGKPSVGSSNVVILKSIFMGDPGTNDGNCE